MSITDSPETRIRVDGRREVTYTPVAFRASRWHPWRSYEANNPIYKRNFETRFYSFDRHPDGGDVLYIVTEKFLGIECWLTCVECGNAFSVYLPSDWKPVPLSILCASCATKDIDNLPMPMRAYTPAYQRSLATRGSESERNGGPA